MTCSKLDDSAINGSGYAVTTVHLERGAEISSYVGVAVNESTRIRTAQNVVACRVHSDGTWYSPFVDLKSILNKVRWNVLYS
ncbi:hypothetical protein NUBL22002_50560 [Klebsiella variicola]|nr:hypothetical protein NUBL22002_50560 [Klebsiella variicola]